MMIKANVYKKFLSLFTISRHFYCRTMVCFPLNTFLLKIMTMSYRATGRAENCSSPNPCFSPPEFTGTGLRYEKHGINITCREKCSALSGMPIYNIYFVQRNLFNMSTSRPWKPSHLYKVFRKDSLQVCSKGLFYGLATLYTPQENFFSQAKRRKRLGFQAWVVFFLLLFWAEIHVM